MTNFRVFSKLLFFILICHESLSCDLGKYPYAVTIRITKSRQQICGGTLLQSRWVLSAAHCIYDFRTSTPPLSVMIKSGYQMVKVKKAFIHNLYDPKTVQRDVSLLFVDEGLPALSTYGRLAGTQFTLDAIKHELGLAHIFGWAVNHYKVKVDKMVTYCIPVYFVDSLKCLIAYRELFDIQFMCCVINEDLESDQPCRGDSGSPMIFQEAVVGIVSFGVECRRDPPLLLPSVLTRIDKTISFINETLSNQGYNLTREILGDYVYYSVPAKQPSLHTSAVYLLIFIINVILRCI